MPSDYYLNQFKQVVTKDGEVVNTRDIEQYNRAKRSLKKTDSLNLDEIEESIQEVSSSNEEDSDQDGNSALPKEKEFNPKNKKKVKVITKEEDEESFHFS
mmetsp:Transcript_34621/g.52957  ORF Transcript_34621/g.52957 Transcript_34621/m.52957 type:complete len:100 (+) Transcript_34621:4005-4304(+)